MTRRHALPGVAPPGPARNAEVAGSWWPRVRSPHRAFGNQIADERAAQDHRLRQGCVLHPVEDAFAAPADGHHATHGALVSIFVRNDPGRIFFEGIAHLGPPTGFRHFEHWVTFVGESRPRRRLVLPGPYQSDPEGVIAGLSALYADAGAPDSLDTFLSDVIGHVANDNTPATDKEA